MTALRYLVIEEDGSVHDRSAPDWWAALDDVGPEGWNRVQLTRDLAAFINDCGLILPKYGRNPVGGALLHCLGAQPIPYAGPIVLAGWDQLRTYEDESEVVSLTDLQVAAVGLLANWVASIVTGSTVVSGAGVDAVQAAAEIVRTGSVPGFTVTSL
jgi:hypothetical protein